MTYSTQENFVGPTLAYDKKSKLYRLVEDYTLEYGNPGFRKRLTMKAGFEYDKASVPRLLWGIARPDGPWDAASLFHDRLYRDKGKFSSTFYFETLVTVDYVDRDLFSSTINQKLKRSTWKLDESRWTRSEADDLLAFVGRLGGASAWEAQEYKWAVKVYPPNWFKGF